jgi:hypothetical protein
LFRRLVGIAPKFRRLRIKLKLLIPIIIALAMSAVAYAQAGFARRWSSDAAEVAAAEAAMRTLRNALPVLAVPGGQVATTATASIEGVPMDLAVSGNKVSGTITQGSMTIVIMDGIVEGKNPR